MMAGSKVAQGARIKKNKKNLNGNFKYLPNKQK